MLPRERLLAVLGYSRSRDTMWQVLANRRYVWHARVDTGQAGGCARGVMLQMGTKYSI